MDAHLLNWILGAVGTIATTTCFVVAYLYKGKEDITRQILANSERTITSLREQVLGLERERAQLQQTTAEARERLARMKGEFKANVEALQVARIWHDPGAMVGTVKLLGEGESTGVYHVEGYHARKLFLGAKEEAERRRQASLNPEADRREKERLDALLRRYSDSSNPPPSEP